MDEDDGQIARELVPVDEAFMRKDEDDEGTGPALGLEQKCNKAFNAAFKRWLVLWGEGLVHECDDKTAICSSIYLSDAEKDRCRQEPREGMHLLMSDKSADLLNLPCSHVHHVHRQNKNRGKKERRD